MYGENMKCKYCWDQSKQFYKPCKCQDPICAKCLEFTIINRKQSKCEICMDKFNIAVMEKIIKMKIKKDDYDSKVILFILPILIFYPIIIYIIFLLNFKNNKYSLIFLMIYMLVYIINLVPTFIITLQMHKNTYQPHPSFLFCRNIIFPIIFIIPFFFIPFCNIYREAIL